MEADVAVVGVPWAIVETTVRVITATGTAASSAEMAAVEDEGTVEQRGYRWKVRGALK